MQQMYLATELMSILILLILLYANIYEIRQHSKKRTIFTQLTLLNLILISADAITWMHLGWAQMPVLFGILLSLTYILPFFGMDLFSEYIYEHLSVRTVPNKKIFRLMHSCTGTAELITIALCPTGKLFLVRDGVYISGPWEHVYYLFYILELFFLAVVILSYGRKLGLHDLLAALSFCATPFLFLIVSLLTDTENLTVPFTVLHMILIYILLQSEGTTAYFNQSNTDALTGLSNRHAYEIDLLQRPDIPPEADFVYLSVDVNGLKQVNDTLGHAAGDELIRGAAACLNTVFGAYGKVYRMGGDEFTGIIFANEEKCKALITELEALTFQWKGTLADSLALSLGYAEKREFPGKTIKELEKIADERMYLDKERYYSQKGIDRRGLNEAHKLLCSLYTKILKINLTTDTFTIISMEEAERDKASGFSVRISQWLELFGRNGYVHPDDLENYLTKTSPAYMRNYFRQGKTSLTIYYRRKHGDRFKQAMMEIIPAGDYADENQSLFLYVKDFDL